MTDNPHRGVQFDVSSFHKEADVNPEPVTRLEVLEILLFFSGER